MKLVLFDIDGTLMDSGGAGRRALEYSFEELFGIPDAFRAISMSGKTDPQIFDEALAKFGISMDGNGPVFMKTYIRYLEREIEKPGKVLMPGVSQALSALKGMGQVSLGLLTGNYEQGARIKLGALGIWNYFGFGAFGSDDADRDKLLPYALKRFQALKGLNSSFSDCVVVGDTPRDVSCAKPYGAAAVAVATGKYSVDELSATGADYVLPDLSDLKKLLNCLGLGPGE
ncbi:MAG: HAD family hydrolase [Actinomycetota bacterium]|nr:HAD family hydrolase [Actinomycetota bacterium]